MRLGRWLSLSGIKMNARLESVMVKYTNSLRGRGETSQADFLKSDFWFTVALAKLLFGLL